MSKFKYYLSTINIVGEDRSDIILNIKEKITELKNVDLKVFIDYDVIFNSEIPDINGGSMCIDNINDNRILKYPNLSTLIEDFVFGYDEFIDDDEVEEEIKENPFDVDEEINGRIDLLLTQFLILRKNIKSNKYSIVSDSEIINCFNKYQENIMEMSLPENIEFEESDEFSQEFENLIKEIESLIEKDFGRLTVTSGISNDIYEFAVFKKDGELHNKMIKEKIKFNEDIHNDIFMFEIDLNELKKLMQYTLNNNTGIGIILRTPISDVSVFDDKNKNKPLMKLYGVGVYNHNDKFTLNKFNANELLKACTINARTGEPITPEKNVIYCGFEDGDVICGFDLV